jgi:hypothetical protein
MLDSMGREHRRRIPSECRGRKGSREESHGSSDQNLVFLSKQRVLVFSKSSSKTENHG